MKYTGILDPTKMSKGPKQGYTSWKNQRAKCYNPRHPDYKYYGGKGVRVLYSSRDFVAWWITNLKTKNWVKPTVGRIDHDGNYCFENIEMQEDSENKRERCKRLGPPPTTKTAPKRVIAFGAYGTKLDEFKSLTAAAKAYNLDVSTIVRHCKKKFDGSRCGLTFRYAEDI